MVGGGFVLRIEAEGEALVERRLLRFAGNLEHPEAALAEAGTILREASERQFVSEGGYASGGWKQLTAARIAYKAKHGLDPHILRATDRLMNALTRKFDPNHIERASGDSLVFGANVPYGVFHQSSRPRTVMPFRPPMALTPEDKRQMVKRIQAALLSSADKAVWGS